MTQPTDLADRYGAPAPWRRRAVIAVSVVVVAAFLGWLGWTIWDQSTPQVRSDLVGYDVVDEHESTATVDVRLADSGVVASCTLRAFAEDHTVVGELVFVPRDGESDQSVRTERRATSVELLGCTAPGQNRPR
ncbi:DUF4307 domain-containing protein [Nocardioides sp. URHA0020]|uniref:DUF4307 domain-containing protein n=1 Tax=Nocardioides sp. URHA0020 TaxID=1380392 RepID=UPI00048AD6EB|nr:DUF4307 domain-containing protein [Nocardioides sp. URHA0020]